MRTAFFTAIATLAASCATAQQATSQAQTSPPPPCQPEIYRAFDFWVGDWEVFDHNDQKAGENKISIQENGCLLLEEWTGAQGSTGQSYNFFDPGMEKWRQVWVSSGATIDYAGGLNDQGAMELEGEIAYRTGKTAPFKGTWTLQDDGSVRQHFEQYDAEKKEWSDWFIGIYKKKAAAE